MNGRCQSRSHVSHLSAIATMFLLAACIAGCSRRQGLVPVEGTVRFDGRPPPAAGTLYFVPKAETDGLVNGSKGNPPARAGVAVFDQSGRYRVMSFREGDGLLPGSYLVRIECWVREPDHVGKDGVSAVPSGLDLPPLVLKTGTRGPVRYDVHVPGRLGGATR